MSAKGRRSVRLHPSTIALPTPPDRLQHTTTPRSRSNVTKTPRRSAVAPAEDEWDNGAASIEATSSTLESTVKASSVRFSSPSVEKALSFEGLDRESGGRTAALPHLASGGGGGLFRLVCAIAAAIIGMSLFGYFYAYSGAAGVGERGGSSSISKSATSSSPLPSASPTASSFSYEGGGDASAQAAAISKMIEAHLNAVEERLAARILDLQNEVETCSAEEMDSRLAQLLLSSSSSSLSHGGEKEGGEGEGSSSQSSSILVSSSSNSSSASFDMDSLLDKIASLEASVATLSSGSSEPPTSQSSSSPSSNLEKLLGEITDGDDAKTLGEKLDALLAHVLRQNSTSSDSISSSLPLPSSNLDSGSRVNGKSSSYYRRQFDHFIKPANLLPAEIRDFLIGLIRTSGGTESSFSSTSSSQRLLDQIIMQSSGLPASIGSSYTSSAVPAELTSNVRFQQLSSSPSSTTSSEGGGEYSESSSFATPHQSLNAIIDGLFSTPSVFSDAETAAAAAAEEEEGKGDMEARSSLDQEFSPTSSSSPAVDLESFLTSPATVGQVLHAINAGIALASYDDIGLPDASRWPLGAIVEGRRGTSGGGAASAGSITDSEVGKDGGRERLWTSKTWRHPDVFNVSTAPLRQTPQMAIRGMRETPFPGDCWPFEAPSGDLMIALSTPLIVYAVTIEHVPSSLRLHHATVIRNSSSESNSSIDATTLADEWDDEVSTASPSSGAVVNSSSSSLLLLHSYASAPKRISIFGFSVSPERQRQFSMERGGARSGDAERLSYSSETHLATFEFDAVTGPPIQTFWLDHRLLHDLNGTHFSYIQWRFESNHGHPHYTCIYRVRVHGVSLSGI